MKLTVEQNRDALQRYRHITPAPRGARPCSERCPGTQRRCTLRRGHGGPHVSHGWFGKVLAAWDKEVTDEKSEARALRAAGALTRAEAQEGTALRVWKLFRDHFLQRIPPMEEAIFLVLALAFLGFAVRWILLIFPFP